MPVIYPKVLCPGPSLTEAHLSSSPTGLQRALLIPQGMSLIGLPCPLTSSMSLHIPTLTSALLVCFSSFLPSLLLSSLCPLIFLLSSLFLPPTDRLQQEQPCTPSPSRFHGSGPNTNSPGPPTFSLALGVGLGGQMRSLPQAPQQASRPVRGGSVCLLLFPWQLAGPFPHSHP